MIGVSFALPTPAAADRVSVTFGPYQASPGGEFTLTPDTPDGLARSVELFSESTRRVIPIFLETSFRSRPSALRRTSSSPPRHYDAATSPYAINGGGGAVVDIDGARPRRPSSAIPSQKGRAGSIASSHSGILSGYDYLGTAAVRKADAAALQDSLLDAGGRADLEREQYFHSHTPCQ